MMVARLECSLPSVAGENGIRHGARRAPRRPSLSRVWLIQLPTWAARPRGELERRHARQAWIIRTYAGHSTAKESNALYRRNLGKGRTGLSVAFDLFLAAAVLRSTCRGRASVAR